ncbi:integrase, catalytic region, zinc finger, CCHC-type containing protein [Tanacetum coccineum]
MSSNSDDIQAAGSDTRPPMLDRTDYDSWSQRIRLYCRGKENGIYILQSIDHGPFELGTTRDTLGTTPEGGVLLGPERPRTCDDLNDNEKKRFDVDVRATNIVLQGLPKYIYKLINHNIEAKLFGTMSKCFLRDLSSPKRIENLNSMMNLNVLRCFLEKTSMSTIVQPYTPSSNVQSYQYPPSSTPLQSPHVQSLQFPQFAENSYLDSRYTQTDEILDTLTKQVALLAQSFRGAGAAGNGGAHNRVGNANAGQGKPIKCYNCNGLGHIAWNCTLLKRLQNSDFFKDKMLLMQAQENGAILDKEELLFLADECDAFDSDVDDEPTAQSIFMANFSSTWPANLQASPSNASILSEKHVIDSNGADIGNSNVIPYEQYLTINEVSVEPSCASSVLNDSYVLHDNNTYIPNDPFVTELNIYKQQVAMYEQRAKFDLTLREQKMDEQMSILIQDRNKKEENLKKELYSVKL